jgi:hypothetical protein
MSITILAAYAFMTAMAVMIGWEMESWWPGKRIARVVLYVHLYIATLIPFIFQLKNSFEVVVK